jgi:hypothetical protein
MNNKLDVYEYIITYYLYIYNNIRNIALSYFL